jgi:hypothetical protein
VSIPLASQTVHPSSRQLVTATVGAIVVAAVILVTVVLPAEYGLDPTGVGSRLGLFRPAAKPADAGPPPSAEGVSTSALVRRDAPFRTDEMSLALKPGEGAEIKAVMAAGDRMVFSWTATGAGVDVDMHGDDGRSDGTSTSYWKDEWQTSGHGAFEAGFAGNHGWFWQNLNDEPVTVTVKVSGYHQMLVRP